MWMGNFKQVFFQKHKTVFTIFSMDYTVLTPTRLPSLLKWKSFGHNTKFLLSESGALGHSTWRFLLKYLYEQLGPFTKSVKTGNGNFRVLDHN